MKLKNSPRPELSMLIAGGCFPVQDNIKEEDLYHQIMRRNLMEQHGLNLSVDILRYETLKSCLEIIRSQAVMKKPDLLLLHLRAEPVLPKIKFFNAYTSREGRIKKSIRVFSKVIIRTSKVSRNSESFTPIRRTGKFHNLLRELNYLAGILALNSLRMKSEYLQLVREVTEYCRLMNIKLIITGPVSRPRSYLENLISEKLDGFFRSRMRGKDKQYVSLLGLENEKKEFLFCEEDLIKVNEPGHRRAAGLILEHMAHLGYFPISAVSEARLSSNL